MPKRKTAPQEAWEKLPKFGQRCVVHGYGCGGKEKTCDQRPLQGPAHVRLSRAQFNRIWQTAYRRGMERAAGVAENARALHDPQRHKSSEEVAGFVAGRNAAASRIKSFIADGAKDE